MANILEEVQRYVADKLNADSQLSACTFLAENRKDIDYEIKKALGREGIVGIVMTPKAVYQGKYEDLFHAWQLDELEIDIVENPIVNRGKKDGYITGQDASMHLFEVLCPKDGPYEGQLNPVSYEEGEDGGLIVNRCILKTLVYGEEGPGPEPTPTLNMYFVKLLDEAPPLSVQPRDGWMWPTDNGFVVWQNGQAHELGMSFDQISSYVESAVSAKADLSDVHGDYIEDVDGNKIEANRTFTWREKCSWYVSEMNDGIYTYDPPLECAWGTYTIDDGLSQKQTQLWMSKTPYTNNEYFGIGADLGYVEYYDKVGEIFVAIAGDTVEEHTDNSITMIGLQSCSITRTGEWSDHTAILATEEWVDDKGYIPYTTDSSGLKSALTIGTRANGSDVGQNSFSVGTSNTASGLNATTIGYNNSAPTQNSIAFGSSNTVSGNSAVAIGSTNNVIAAGSIAIGEQNDISAGSGVAIGVRNNANARWTVAMGSKSQANDSGSFVWSGSNKANVAVFPVYTSHGKGTFNINPQNGADGFYIGEQSLSSMLSVFITSADVPVPSYIEDANGNKIDADGDFTYIDISKWSVEIGTYGEYVLSPTSPEEWTYAEAEGSQGNKKLVLKWVDYIQGWELDYFQWEETMLGWYLLASGQTYDSQQATSLEIDISGDFTETAECRKGAPSTDKLATEGYVDGIVGNINTILDIINGEVI